MSAGQNNAAHKDREAAIHHRDNLAFNAGCDARLAGQSLQVNPYDNECCDTLLAEFWELGWRHVELNWGADVRHRWPYLRLDAYASREAILGVG